MMTREDRQEALSLAYVHAVAAVCGMTHSTRSKDYGIDVSIHEVEKAEDRFFESGVQFDIQVKSTTSVTETRTTIHYDLSIKAYEDLRFPSDKTRILVVYLLPSAEAEWFKQTRSKLELRRCAHWVSLRGQPAVGNQSSVRVKIPKRQLFTPDALRWIMDRIRAKETLS